jgi:LruC domain-containing protein
VDPRYNVPAGDDFFTVAYEDYFPHVGDADFNDFVVQYNIEVTEESGFVSEYTVNATARARAAGFEHEFGFVLQYPGFRGIYTGTYEQVVNGEVVSQKIEGDSLNSARIVLFPSTKSAFKRQSSRVTVDNGFLGEPLSEGLNASFTISFRPFADVSPEDVEAPPLDPYLLTEKGYDVHLIGKPALDGSKNFEVPLSEWENFLDQNGYPRALLVPTAWPHPLELTKIDNAYSDFTTWRESNGKDQRDWYERPTDGLVFQWPSGS